MHLCRVVEVFDCEVRVSLFLVIEEFVGELAFDVEPQVVVGLRHLVFDFSSLACGLVRPPARTDVNLHRANFALLLVHLHGLDVLAVGVFGVVPRSNLVVEPIRVQHSLVDGHLLVDCLQSFDRQRVLVGDHVIQFQDADVETRQRLFDRCRENSRLFLSIGDSGRLKLTRLAVVQRNAMLREQCLKQEWCAIVHRAWTKILLFDKQTSEVQPTFFECEVAFDFANELIREGQHAGEHENRNLGEAENPLHTIRHVHRGFESTTGDEQ